MECSLDLVQVLFSHFERGRTYVAGRLGARSVLASAHYRGRESSARAGIYLRLIVLHGYDLGPIGSDGLASDDLCPVTSVALAV